MPAWLIPESAIAVAIDDHLLVVETASSTMRLFNPMAARIWRGLEAGLTADQVAGLLSGEFDVPRTRVLEDVFGQIRDWDRAGLIGPAVSGLQRHSRIAGPGPARMKGALVHRGEYRLNENPFSVEFLAAPGLDEPGRQFIARVVALLEGLSALGSRGEGECVAALEYCAGRFESSVALGNACWREAAPADALGRLYLAILEVAYRPMHWLCTVHAAAVGREGAAVILPAPPGSGKSTLVAFLAAHHWTYLADDVIAIDPRTFRLQPLPTLLGIKEGSLPVLGKIYPGLAAAREFPYGPGKAARYLRLAGPAIASRSWPLSAMVFPKYVARSATSPSRISAARAGLLLMESGVAFSGAVTRNKVEWIARLLQKVPCHEICYSDLAEAEAALASIALQAGGA